MNPLVILLPLGAGLLWLASRAKPASSTSIIIRRSKPWEHEGVTYRVVEWKNGQVDLFGQVGDRIGRVRYQAIDRLAPIDAAGDPNLVILIRAYAANRQTLVQGTS